MEFEGTDMSSQEQTQLEPIDSGFEDLPTGREYDSDELAELDRTLEYAISLAEDAGYSYLATLLELELKSLYYKSR